MSSIPSEHVYSAKTLLRGQAGRHSLLSDQLAGTIPAWLPAGRAARQAAPAGKEPLLQKTTETNCSGLPPVPPCQQAIPTWDETKCQHPRIFHEREINTLFWSVLVTICRYSTAFSQKYLS